MSCFSILKMVSMSICDGLPSSGLPRVAAKKVLICLSLVAHEMRFRRSTSSSALQQNVTALDAECCAKLLDMGAVKLLEGLLEEDTDEQAPSAHAAVPACPTPRLRLRLGHTSALPSTRLDRAASVACAR